MISSNHYRRPTGILVILLVSFALLVPFIYGSISLASYHDINLILAITPAAILALLLVWKSIYQSTMASFSQRGAFSFYCNGLYQKCLGTPASLKVKRRLLFGLLLFIEGDVAGVWCFGLGYKLN